MAYCKSFKINIIPSIQYLQIQRNIYGQHTVHTELKKCYKLLRIPDDSDQEAIRAAYLQLVKRYHPDSGTTEADSSKFQEIDEAFKTLLHHKSKERWDVREESNIDQVPQQFDIKHTAPQHRQYLSYDGMGFGTPFQREKQYVKIRAMHAAENLLNHRVNKATAEENALMVKGKPGKTKHDIKTKHGVDRLVEDLIQESMARGEFDNLSGKGKPLPTHQQSNPYVDFVTHKMNQVLIDNGFTPEWITLQKEIRTEKQQLQDALFTDRTSLGDYPWDDVDEHKWGQILEKYKKLTDQLNKKIEKYNLVVPVLQKQMLLITLSKIARPIAEKGITKHQIEIKEEGKNEAQQDPKNIFSFFESFFIK